LNELSLTCDYDASDESFALSVDGVIHDKVQISSQILFWSNMTGTPKMGQNNCIRVPSVYIVTHDRTHTSSMLGASVMHD
jgi:hypothetical protein